MLMSIYACARAGASAFCFLHMNKQQKTSQQGAPIHNMSDLKHTETNVGRQEHPYACQGNIVRSTQTHLYA